MWLAIKKLIVVLTLPIVSVFSPPTRGSPVPPPSSPEAVHAEQPVPQPVMGEREALRAPLRAVPSISAATLRGCLNQAAAGGECLDRVFREFLKTHTAAEALAIVKGYEATDATLRLSCHPVVHAIGRETFRLKGTVGGSFAACDQTCHSGCYHGAMERFLRGAAASDGEAGHISREELQAKASGACSQDQPSRFRFQCLHGLGHALMFFSDYRLGEALAACDTLADSWSRSSCYGGVFMENVFSATPEKRDLSPTDVHYPCSGLDPKYRGDCYIMQTTRMLEMGLSTKRLFEECRKAGEYRYACMQSIGRDLSNDARVKDPRTVSEKCELGTGEERRACTRGVAYALMDNTWDGSYAFPFCAAFRGGDDAAYCFGISEAYLQSTFAKTKEEIANDCRKYAASAKLCTQTL